MPDLKVSFQASNGQWFVAEAAEGGDRVQASRGSTGEWETFELRTPVGVGLASGAPVTLRTHRGRYLCAVNGGGGAVTADRPEAKDWETFRIVRVAGEGQIASGDKVALRAANGLYVVADGGGGGRLRADRKEIGAWETFTIAIHGGGTGPAAGGKVGVLKMGYWDCPSCGHKRIQGPERSCTGCGTPRAEGVKFYTDDSAPAVTDAGLLARAKAGADWHCQYCGADNPAGAKHCAGCGGGPDGAKRREEKLVAAPAVAVAAAAPSSGSGKKKAGMSTAGKLAALGIVAAIASCVYYFAFYTKEVKVKVERVAWTKALQLESYSTTRREAWAADVPSGAREISRRTENRTKKVQEGTDRVKVGTKDLGNGLFEDIYEDRPRYVERQVPETKVTYEVEEWKAGRRIEQSASDGTEPPEPTFQDTRTERVRSRESVVIIVLRGLEDGKSYDYKLDVEKDASLRERARTVKVGETYTAIVGGTGTVRDLKR